MTLEIAEDITALATAKGFHVTATGDSGLSFFLHGNHILSIHRPSPQSAWYLFGTFHQVDWKGIELELATLTS